MASRVVTLLATLLLTLTLVQGGPTSPHLKRSQTSLNPNPKRGLTSKIELTNNPHILNVQGRPHTHVDKQRLRQHVDTLTSKYQALHVSHNPSIERRAQKATADVDLQREGVGILWLGNMTVGAQDVLVDFDTGSTNLVLSQYAYQPGPDAEQINDSRFVVGYASGQMSYADLWLDTVTFGELPPIQKVAISWAETNLMGDQIGGIVGMAYKNQTAGTKYGGFFERVVSEGLLEQNIFSFALAPGGDDATPELQLGSVSERAIAEPAWTPLVPENRGFWMVNGSIDGAEKTMIIDSGTTLILGHDVDVYNLLSAHTDTVQIRQDPDGTIYGVLLDEANPPKITFTFGDFTFALGPDAITFGKNEDGTIPLSIIGDPLMKNFPDGFWLVGDAALRSVVWTCDWDNERIGWSPHNGTIVV